MLYICRHKTCLFVLIRGPARASHTCFCFLFLPQLQLLFVDLFAAHQLVDGRIFVFTELHQLQTLLVHDSDHVCTVHGAHVLPCLTYHLYHPLWDLTPNAADCGMSSGILLFLLRRISLF